MGAQGGQTLYSDHAGLEKVAAQCKYSSLSVGTCHSGTTVYRSKPQPSAVL